MRFQKLGGTGFEVSAVSYGGVVSSQHFDKAVIPGDGQGMPMTEVGTFWKYIVPSSA